MCATAGSAPSVTIRLECSHSAQPRRYTDWPSRVVSSSPSTSTIQRTVSSGLGEMSSTWASCDSRISDMTLSGVFERGVSVERGVERARCGDPFCSPYTN